MLNLQSFSRTPALSELKNRKNSKLVDEKFKSMKGKCLVIGYSAVLELFRLNIWRVATTVALALGVGCRVQWFRV